VTVSFMLSFSSALKLILCFPCCSLIRLGSSACSWYMVFGAFNYFSLSLSLAFVRVGMMCVRNCSSNSFFAIGIVCCCRLNQHYITHDQSISSTLRQASQATIHCFYQTFSFPLRIVDRGYYTVCIF